MSKPFTLWVFGDAHVGTDLKRAQRESLADAIRQSEGSTGDPRTPAFPWDLAIDVGDMSGDQGLPADSEGEEVLRQLGALQQHPREAIYSVCGNHDRGGIADPVEAAWWRRWVDPTGEHPATSRIDQARRPYPIDGTWERYAFTFGNVRVLMMSDINEPSATVGRGTLGGNPGGVVRGETFDWWVDQVERHPDHLIISVHHYMLKDTTVASGEWEGQQRQPDGTWKWLYHGYFPNGGQPNGSSYLYLVGGKPDSAAFERYLAAHPGSVDLWFGGHTHANPDDRTGGKGLIETRWGCNFVNCAALSRCHGQLNVPMSRVLAFQPGSRQVRVRCYLHDSSYAPQGWYPRAERVLTLSRPFKGP